MTDRIEQEWRAFREKAIRPEDLPPETLETLRGVFFAGAFSVFMACAEAGKMPPTAAFKYLNEVETEVKNFISTNMMRERKRPPKEPLAPNEPVARTERPRHAHK